MDVLVQSSDLQPIRRLVYWYCCPWRETYSCVSGSCMAFTCFVIYFWWTTRLGTVPLRTQWPTGLGFVSTARAAACNSQIDVLQHNVVIDIIRHWYLCLLVGEAPGHFMVVVPNKPVCLYILLCTLLSISLKQIAHWDTNIPSPLQNSFIVLTSQPLLLESTLDRCSTGLFWFPTE